MAGRGRAKTDKIAVRQTEHIREALELRKQGLSFDRIARETGYWKTRQGAHQAVMSALKGMKRENGEELLKLELARLDDYLLALSKRIFELQDTRAIDTALRVNERRCRMLGIDLVRHQISQLSDEELLRQVSEIKDRMVGDGDEPEANEEKTS